MTMQSTGRAVRALRFCAASSSTVSPAPALTAGSPQHPWSLGMTTVTPRNFRARQQRLADRRVHVVDAAAGEEGDGRLPRLAFDQLRHPLAEGVGGELGQGARRIQVGQRKAQPQAAVLRHFFEQQLGEPAAAFGQEVEQLLALEDCGHPLAEGGEPLLLRDAPPGGGDDLLGRHLVRALGVAAAAEQALGEVVQDLFLQVDLPVEQRLGQGHLAAGDPSFVLLGAEHRAVGAAGAALDALLDLFAVIFRVL